MSSDTVPVTQAELLPCPFCGGPAIDVADSLNAVEAPDQVACTFCAAMADASKWNTRATPTPSPVMLSREEIIAVLIPMEDFINEPPRLWDIEPMEVRDYRHEAYRVWSNTRDAILALTSVDRAGQGFVMVPRDAVGRAFDLLGGVDDAAEVRGELLSALSASPKTHSEKAQA